MTEKRASSRWVIMTDWGMVEMEGEPQTRIRKDGWPDQRFKASAEAVEEYRRVEQELKAKNGF